MLFILQLQVLSPADCCFKIFVTWTLEIFRESGSLPFWIEELAGFFFGDEANKLWIRKALVILVPLDVFLERDTPFPPDRSKLIQE